MQAADLAATDKLKEPQVISHETFLDVLIKSDLRKANERINLYIGEPWLNDARISQAVKALECISAAKRMESDQQSVDRMPDGNHFPSKMVDCTGEEHAKNIAFTLEGAA